MSHRTYLAVVMLAALILLTLTAVSTSYTLAAGPLPPGDASRGAYIVQANGGCGCHQGQAGAFAGGQKFEGPFGVVYARNITPDKETGIGNWTDEQVAGAIRTGMDNQGKTLFPVMPYPYFSGMADQDVADLVAFLRTLPPIKNAVPEDQLKGPVPPFTPRAAPPATAPTSGVARGAYLVNGISLCVLCHTPSLPNGQPDMSKFLAGGFNAETGAVEPNITPDDATGIGTWSQEQIFIELKTGVKPGGSHVQGLMAAQVDGGYKNLTEQDGFAIAAYLKTVPPVGNPSAAPNVTTGGSLGSATGGAPPAAAPSSPVGQPPSTLPTTGGSSVDVQVLLAMALGGLVLLVLGWVLARRLARS